MAISVVCTSGMEGGGGFITLTLANTSTTIFSGDNIIVGFVRTIEGGADPVVLSSNGTSYTQLVPPITASGIGPYDFSVYGRVASDGELTLTCDNLRGPVAGVYAVFRSPTANLSVTQNSTTGISSQPDSPNIAVPSSNCAVLSAWGLAGDALSVTPPTVPSAFSLLFAVQVGSGNCATGMGWITYPSIGPIDPGPWVITPPNTGWSAATIVLGSTDLIPPNKRLTAFSVHEMLPYAQKTRVVGY